jgi:hypothetical protein
MTSRNLTVDGMLSGTGIRDLIEGGYVEPSDLGVSSDLCARIENWLSGYEAAHYKQFKDGEEVERLDAEGVEIARNLKEQMEGYSIGYYSNAKLKAVQIM